VLKTYIKIFWYRF